MREMDRIPDSFYAPPELRTERLKSVIEHDRKYALYRPSVPGKVVEYVYVPAMGFLAGRIVRKGQVIRIIDLEGRQVADTIVWDASNLENVMTTAWTMVLNKRWNKWQPGDALFSKGCNKLATLTEDTTDGTHFAGGAFCNERANYVRYGIPGTVNCRDNLVAAMAHYGLSASDLDWGSCFSFFMDVTFNPDGSSDIAVAHTKSGDYFDLMAEMDIIIAFSNCPSIRTVTNDYNPTSMMGVIFNPNEDYIARASALPGPDVLTV